MNEPESSWGTEHIDGHSLDELSEYAARGRTPPDPSIDGSPACLLALAALDRLRRATGDLITEESGARPVDGSWVARVLNGIRLDLASGRRIPVSHPSEQADLAISEAALRSLVRGAGDSVDGVIVGRCDFDGDVETHGAKVVVRVEIAVPYGEPIPGTVERVRLAIWEALSQHTELNVEGIDITVDEMRLP